MSLALCVDFCQKLLFLFERTMSMHKKSCNYFTQFTSCKVNKINICVLGRYSPVRRASEGSRNPQGPFQECQQLQNSLAAQQRNNYLVTPTNKPENSVSLPGEENLKFFQSHFWFTSVSPCFHITHISS